MNLLALSPALKVATGLAVGAAFAGAVALTATHGGASPRPTFNAGTLDATPTAFVEKVPSPVATVIPRATPNLSAKGNAQDCPAGWGFFDNTAVQYTLCIPPGWGFHLPGTALPVLSPPVQSRQPPILYSPEWFPFPLDATQAIGSAGRLQGISISLYPVSSYAGFAGCQANQPRQIGGKQGLDCEDTYDIVKGEGVVRPDGARHTLKIFVPIVTPAGLPLLSGETPTDRFVIYVESSTVAFNAQSKVISQIIDSLRLY